MFFELHDEKRIGYKKLSQADLGIGKSSNQTHIGLSEYVLKYLDNRDVINEDSIFIFENSFEFIDAYFDRIKNKDGSFRSPKIRIGKKGCVSVVSTIRGIVKDADSSLEWYLIWFGLKSEKLVFFLLHSDSEDYEKVTALGVELTATGAKYLSSKSSHFEPLALYVESKINETGEKILEELEIIVQTGIIEPSRKFRQYDLDKAIERNKEIGRKGEELIKLYLEGKIEEGEITDLTWCNEQHETGTPYDFFFKDASGKTRYFDVKTTERHFAQKIVCSSQEMNFASTAQDSYGIYRVYKNENGEFSLKICDDCKGLSAKITASTTIYSNVLTQLNVDFKGSKLAFSPTLSSLKFSSEISLNSFS